MVFSDMTRQTAKDPWFVVRVRPNCERKAASSLTARGIDVLVPDYHRPTRRKPQLTARLPLFPGYIFCQLASQPLVSVLSASGVITILSRNGTPEAVNHNEMHWVSRLMTPSTEVSPWPVFVEGERVRISSGPLQGVEGVVLRDNVKATLAISISLLQRSVVTDIERRYLEGC